MTEEGHSREETQRYIMKTLNYLRVLDSESVSAIAVVVAEDAGEGFNISTHLGGPNFVTTEMLFCLFKSLSEHDALDVLEEATKKYAKWVKSKEKGGCST